MNVFSLNGNWVDLIIILIIFHFLLDSFRHNFFIILIEFISFLSSLLLGFLYYQIVAGLLMDNFSLPNSISNSIGFFVIVALSEAILVSIMLFIFKKIPDHIKNFRPLAYLRFIIGIFDGLLLVAFLIPLALSFPIPARFKDSITSSRIGGLIYEKTPIFEKRYNDIFGGIINEGVELLTVDPGTKNSISLNISRLDLSVDAEAEKNMLELINIERKKVGVETVSIREELLDVARDYAKDMWERNYFSHYSPEGEDVAIRLDNAGIDFNTVGENLALAPTVIIAHTGLMNSEGHRKNILDSTYKQVAIGVVDNGAYGKIFVQIFTD